MARELPLRRLFDLAPTLAVWAVLRPLALNYGASTKDVYVHISRFVAESFDDASERDDLKFRFRKAARSLGLPVHGNEPTNLFFSPLGPVRAQHSELARAFVTTALRLGPPAIEDTAAARHWQRHAVRDRCPNHTRLKAAIDFDAEAYVARRFEAWRHGADPTGENETHLFAAYDLAARNLGHTRSDLVGPPQLFWADDSPGLEVELSRTPQSLRLGAFPSRIAAGDRVRVPPPWSRTIRWTAGSITQDVSLAPDEGEVFIFDADSGSLLARVPEDESDVELAAERLVILTQYAFTSPSFGGSIPAQDPDFHVAWVNVGETLAFDGRSDLALVHPREEAVWIDAPILGRDGGRALYACDGVLNIKIDPDIGGRTRIVRTRFGDEVHFHEIDLGPAGEATMAFSEARLDRSSDPAEVLFEVLTPGAVGDLDARGAMFIRCWVWPGLPAPEEDLLRVPIPSNIDRARCAGLLLLDGTLSVDPHADQECPILGIHSTGRSHEFQLVARSEKLWQYHVDLHERRFVPRGATLQFGHVNRHDTLLLRSPDRNASLLVLGQEIRRPFLQRQTIEIGASQLETAHDGDDRIALRRADGRVDLLARLQRISDPAGLEITESEDEVSLQVTPQSTCNALRVRIEPVASPVLEGEYAFSGIPAEIAPLPAVKASRDAFSGQIEIQLRTENLPTPARVTFTVRDDTGRHTLLRDVRKAPIAIGLPGDLRDPLPKHLLGLARLLADPEPQSLGGQVMQALSPAYEAALDRVGVSRMLGPIKQILAVTREDEQPPRHDLVAAAPWIFEAPPLAFGGLDARSGLSQIGAMAFTPAPSPPPCLDGDEPLSTWLDRVRSGTEIPFDFDADKLQNGFRALRYRLKETDLHDLVGGTLLSRTVKTICAAHAEGLDHLRSFDSNGGGDPLPVRIALQIERHARACAEGRAQVFVSDIVFRTGLPRREIGQALTLMLRAGVEIFSYFRALWAHASR